MLLVPAGVAKLGDVRPDTDIRFPGAQLAQPEGFVFPPKGKPPVELVPAYAVFLTGFFSREMADEMVGQDPENEEGAIPGIRNDDIRQDGMGALAAVTNDTHDPDLLPHDGTVPELLDAPLVITVDMAFSCGTAVRAGVPFRVILGHVGLE